MLVLERVEKSFYDPKRGAVRAVHGLSAQVDSGVLALVGANGAGKSTLLRLIATLLTPDHGRVLVDGYDTATEGERVRARLAYLSTTTRIYARLTGRELLAYIGGFFDLAGAALADAIERQVAAFGLAPFIDQRIAALSTGQLQRVNLARTLLADPALLVLDEPTTGLDIIAAWNLVEAVRSSARPGRLIIIATHILPEVERAADRLWILRDGALVHDGPPAALGSGPAFAAAVHSLIAADAGARA